MQPNSDNGVNNGAVPVSNAVPAAGGVVNPNVAAQRNDVKSVPVPEKPKKKSNAMMLGMIIFALLAAGGIGFGVWEMMDGNAQIAKKDEQIADLNRQLAEKSQFEVEQDDEMLVEDIVDDENVLENDKRTCEGTYYGELTGDADMKYTYVLNKNGTSTADFGTWTTNGTFAINDNTISLTGKNEIYGGPSPSFVTTDAVVAEDCSYIMLPYEGNYVFELKKQ